jgi:signal transduction histidine kinase
MARSSSPWSRWSSFSVREVAEDLPRAVPRRVTIAVEGDASLAVCGDRRRLVQIAHNLLDNACSLRKERVTAAVTAAGGRVVL